MEIPSDLDVGASESDEIHRARLEDRFRQQVAEVEAIDEIVLGIGSSLDLGSTLQAIADAAATLSGAPYSSIWLRDSAGSYRAMAAHGVPLDRLQRVVLKETEGLIADMRRTGLPVEVADVSQDAESASERREEIATTHARATLGVPLLQGGDVVGALYVAGTESGWFPAETVAVMRRLAAFAQVALQNAQRFSDLEAERSRLQGYVDAIPEAVLVFDRDGRVVLINETLRREWGVRSPMVGLSREDVFRLSEQYSARRLRLRFDPDAVFERVLKTGKSEQGLLEMDDSSRTFEMHFSALRRDGGKIAGIVVTVRDITLALQLGRERSRSHLLAQLLDLSVLLNSNLSVNTLIERVVEAAMDLVGASAGTIGLLEAEQIVFRRFRVGTTWRDIRIALHRGQGVAGQVWETMQPYVSNDCSADPHSLPELQAELGFHRLVDVPMVDSTGRLVGTLEVHDPVVERDFGRTDVETLQLLAHQAAIAIENARLNQLKDEFLSIVSHELKTPVTSIKGFAQVLKRRLSPESLGRGERYLDIINQQADRLSGLINDLLDLSRIQSGRFSFETVLLDYGQLLRDVIAEMQLMVPNNPIELEAAEGTTVRGSADRLRQVLTNLIDNAVKHGPVNGRVRLTVEAHDDEVTTCVHDEGRELPAGEAERIFLPYYQVRDSGRQQAKGLGLGLFITQQIVEGHGGRIWLDTADHTTFCFTLPRG